MKKLLCTILLLSLTMMTACGKTEPATAEATDKETENTNASTADSSAAEYPSISKVTYDALFTAIDKDELRDFVTEYVEENDDFKDHDGFKMTYLGSLFEYIGVPGTENYANRLAYFYIVDFDEGQHREIHMAITKNISFESEGKVSDMTFEIWPLSSLKDSWKYDEETFASKLSDPELNDSICNKGANALFGIDYFSPEKHNDAFYEAYANGTCDFDHMVESDEQSDLIEAVHQRFVERIDDLLEEKYPDLIGKNSGTFSQD